MEENQELQQGSRESWNLNVECPMDSFLFQDQQEQQAMMQDPVYNYFPGLETGVESAGPIFNIQVGT